ncbi:hypothetical protein [Saccharicrinis aurantiacus]|uniref:hypothetical protein n=1 Tax=Saccharicrinis aurantiacus TaxID=1849719 RepID=UPI0024927819|nr:hypothetical protein [Saccharicrinis aurantiacus]
MTPQEIEHQDWKNKMRKKALEKELVRLRKNETKNLKKISDLRKSIIFIGIATIILFFLLHVTGTISFTPKDNIKNNNYNFKINSLEDSVDFLNKKIDILVKTKASIVAEKGYRFKVQFGAFKSNDLDKYSENLVSLNQKKYNRINHYTLGSFENLNKANEFLIKMKEIGFTDSFIIATLNGNIVPIEEAKKHFTEQK